MSETKTRETAASGSKTVQAGKSDTAKPKSGETAKSSGSDAGGSASSPPKSASETSISHFSSVSSPAYKAGWESIFGGSKAKRKGSSKSAKGDPIPDQLTLEDDDIGEELRAALYKAFQKQARKQGTSLAKIKKRVELSYSLRCDIEEK